MQQLWWQMSQAETFLLGGRGLSHARHNLDFKELPNLCMLDPV